eukprot:NODE_7_length_48057_cov_0.322240.p3 type:complete len:791 gc:universal NODE_7_length_48057_cov_0.322240:47513-45141(-)
MSSVDEIFKSLQAGSTTDDVFGLFLQFLLASVTGIAAIVAFTVLRPRNKKVYQPNFYVLENEKHPPILSYSFKWIYQLFTLDDNVILTTSGVDGLLTIKVLLMFLKMFLILTPVCLVILIPIHSMGISRNSLLSISLLSVINTPDYLYAHVVIMYFISAVVSYFTINMWHYYIKIRLLNCDNFYNQSKTVFYTGITNKNKPHCIGQHIYNKFGVACTGILLNDPSFLIKLFDQYNTLLGKLEQYCHDNPDNPHRAVTMINDLTVLKSKIHDEQLLGMTSINYLPSGFGIFHNPTDAYKCSGKSILRSASWTPYHAVDVNDIVWNNVKMSSNEIKSRRLLGRVLSIGFIFFWLIPIIFLAPLTRLSVLTQYVPFIAPLLSDYPKFAAFIQSVLTPLLLKLLLLFIPDIFYFIANLQAEPTNSEIQKSSLRKLFLFFILGYFMLFTFSTSIWFLVSKLQSISNVESFVTVLNAWTANMAEAIIYQGIYWINWFTLNGPGSIPIDLARFIPFLLIKYKLRKSLTSRQLQSVLKPPVFRYDIVLVSNLFMFFLAILYSVIHPIILVFGLLYFLISYIVYKYQVLYVFSSQVDTFGSFWPIIFNRIYAALFTSQLILILLLRVYMAYIQSWLLVILLFGTLGVYYMQKIKLKRRFKIPTDEQYDEKDEKFSILHPLYFKTPDVAMLDDKMEPLLMPYLEPTTQSLREVYMKQQGMSTQGNMQMNIQPRPSQDSMASMQQRPSMSDKTNQYPTHSSAAQYSQSKNRYGRNMEMLTKNEPLLKEARDNKSSLSVFNT